MNFKINENEIDLFMDPSDSEPAGYVQFEIEEGILNLNHTVVSEKFRGMGLAKSLMEGTIKFAKEKGLKIKPNCSYAAAYFEKNNIPLK